MAQAGWLEKRGEINTAWKNRYFMLTADNQVTDTMKLLRYFKDEESSRNARNGGSIEIDDEVKVYLHPSTPVPLPPEIRPRSQRDRDEIATRSRRDCGVLTGVPWLGR